MAFFFGDHFQRQFIVIAQKGALLAVGGDWRGLLENPFQRRTVGAVQRDKDARHEREVEGQKVVVKRDFL